LSLYFAHCFYVCPDFAQRGSHLHAAIGESFPDDFASLVEAFVEMELCDLCGQPALDVVDGETAGAGMAWFDDVKEVVVRCAIPELVVFGLLPGVDERECKVCSGIAFDSCSDGFAAAFFASCEILMILGG
jgi:hypothetical protein